MADKKLVAQKTIAKKLIASVEQIESRIFLIRGQKVMLDVDLAERYGVVLPRFHGYSVKSGLMDITIT